MTGRRKPKQKPILYFFFEGDLHKRLHIHRSDDIITAWNYPKGKMCKHSYSQVRREGAKAFSTKQVAEMVHRNRATLDKAIARGYIERPQFSYGLDDLRNEYAMFWSEKDIMALHSYLKTVHIGRPRKDGRITTGKLPSVAELRALIRQGTVLYVKSESGDFIPTWDAEKF